MHAYLHIYTYKYVYIYTSFSYIYTYIFICIHIIVTDARLVLFYLMPKLHKLDQAHDTLPVGLPVSAHLLYGQPPLLIPGQVGAPLIGSSYAR